MWFPTDSEKQQHQQQGCSDRHHQNVTRNRADELEPSLRMYEDEMAAIERLALRRPAIQHVVTHGLDSVR